MIKSVALSRLQVRWPFTRRGNVKVQWLVRVLEPPLSLVMGPVKLQRTTWDLTKANGWGKTGVYIVFHESGWGTVAGVCLPA